ncbi:MAG: hypothetical protein K6F09_02430 [Clostridiales bacterium]|nr:hypothetical protein [Clostridiales bacterium]
MAAYNTNTAYDYFGAEPARKRRPVDPPESPRSVPHVVRPKPKTDEQIKRELTLHAKQILKVIVVAVVLFTLFGSVLFEKAKLVDLTIKEAQYTEALQRAEAKKVSLDARFKSLISVDSVEEYARDKLGMTKRQRYQTKYFVLNGNDEVVLANGKTTENK